ncbi:BamA/TamA family outer membrane protein [Flavobacteriaceae bacterium TP-CH-4]|uniref:BamA/TamA family outer membrane protein n=2 Tax=Pelagihabitans pacificus TaxID=2696054 RepID=A0A967AQ33_9FLAO|nr:BamA/TamA family outer membrane protein [Pelagihabitans pacificus]
MLYPIFLRVVLLAIFLLPMATPLAYGQDFKDFKDIFTFYPNKRKVQKDSSRYLAKLVAAPVISYSPETSLGIGVGAKYLFKFNGSGPETRTSNMPATLQYTLNNQFVLFSGFEVFTNQEEWVIEGNVLVQNYPRLFYGIGRDAPKENKEEYNYVQVLVEPIFLKQAFFRYLFVGAGVRYNQIFDVQTEAGGILETEQPLGYEGSTSMSAEFAMLYDSRNNILNANSGWYFEFTHGFYGKVLGGTHNFELSRFDLRHYFTPFKNKKDVLAVQFIGHFSQGEVPFSELGLFGGSEILRGYREGRYVARTLLAGQLEYRTTFGDSRYGMVAFVGGGDVNSNLGDFKLGNIRPNFGIGLRFLLDRSENLNIRLDWGFGEASNNLYLDIAEAF